MALHLEFVVPGPPIFNQQSRPQGRRNLAVWRALVGEEARGRWSGSCLARPLKAVVINFHAGDTPSVDVDNMSKPILDALQGLVYDDDRRIRQVEIAHLGINGRYVIAGASKLIVDALHAGDQFVYVRVEDPADPYPLPR